MRKLYVGLFLPLNFNTVLLAFFVKGGYLIMPNSHCICFWSFPQYPVGDFIISIAVYGKLSFILCYLFETRLTRGWCPWILISEEAWLVGVLLIPLLKGVILETQFLRLVVLLVEAVVLGSWFFVGKNLLIVEFTVPNQPRLCLMVSPFSWQQPIFNFIILY